MWGLCRQGKLWIQSALFPDLFRLILDKDVVYHAAFTFLPLVAWVKPVRTARMVGLWLCDAWLGVGTLLI